MAHGKHRKKKDSRVKALTVIAVAGTGVVVPATFVGAAHADSATVWDRLAECESGGNFGTSTGNGYYGGFQFSLATWRSVGGTGSPANASPAQQLLLAKVLLAAEGPGQWTCSGRAGLTRATGASQGLSILGGSSTPPATTTPPTSTTGATVNAAKAIKWATDHAAAGDLHYQFGAEGPTYYDCSSFLQAAWRVAGVNTPRDTESMNAGLTHVSQSSMRPGDIILWYFNGTSQPNDATNHSTMYIGDGKMVEASGSRGVLVDNVAGRGGRIVSVVRPDPSGVPTGTTPPPPPVTPPPTTPPPVTPPPVTPPATGGHHHSHHNSHGHRWNGPAAPKAAGTYTVVTGDTLSGIAYSHGSSHWGPLYAANRDVVGANPHLIYPGQVLKLLGGSGTGSGHTHHHGRGESAPPATPSPDPTPTPTPTPTPSTPPAQVADYVAPVAQAPGYAFGVRNSAYAAGYHTGTDFPVATGTPVHAAAGGTVIVGGQGAAYGNHIVIHHADGKYTLYAHLSTIAVTAGATVQAGDVIGLSGATGNVSGPHLHFEVRTSNTYGAVIDPIAWLRSHGVSI